MDGMIGGDCGDSLFGAESLKQHDGTLMGL